MRHKVIAACVIAISFALVCGCSRHVTAAECTEMVDKYVDMEMGRDDEVAHAEPREQKGLLELKKAQKKTEQSYKRALSQCEAEVRKREYDCAMRAETPEGWQACID